MEVSVNRRRVETSEPPCESRFAAAVGRESPVSLRLRRRESASELSGRRGRGKKQRERKASSGISRSVVSGGRSHHEGAATPSRRRRSRRPVSPPLDAQLSRERGEVIEEPLARTPVARRREREREGRRETEGCCCCRPSIKRRQKQPPLAAPLAPFASSFLVLRERQRRGARGPGGEQRQETGETLRCGGGAYL